MVFSHKLIFLIHDVYVLMKIKNYLLLIDLSSVIAMLEKCYLFVFEMVYYALF